MRLHTSTASTNIASCKTVAANSKSEFVTVPVGFCIETRLSTTSDGNRCVHNRGGGSGVWDEGFSGGSHTPPEPISEASTAPTYEGVNAGINFAIRVGWWHKSLASSNLN